MAAVKVSASAPGLESANVILARCSETVQSRNTLQESSEVTHELIGTRWALVRLGDRIVTIREDGREPFIALESADARAVGYAGCNRITGGYELSGEQLSFTQMAATRMACPDMQTEDALLKALDATARWRISGAELDLLNAEGAPVASFEARNL